MWHPGIDVVRSTLLSRKNKKLSSGGHAFIIKSLLYTLLMYFLPFFKLHHVLHLNLKFIFIQFSWRGVRRRGKLIG